MAWIGAAATAAILALAGCGGSGNSTDSGDSKSGQGAAKAESGEAKELQTAADSGDSKSGQRAEKAESGEAKALQTAAEHMKRDNFDGALAILKRAPQTAEVERRTAEFRAVAARETLRNARRQLAATRRRRASPRPAVSLSAVALRYHETPAARRFHERATRALRAHKRRQAAR